MLGQDQKWWRKKGQGRENLEGKKPPKYYHPTAAMRNTMRDWSTSKGQCCCCQEEIPSPGTAQCLTTPPGCSWNILLSNLPVQTPGQRGFPPRVQGACEAGSFRARAAIAQICCLPLVLGRRVHGAQKCKQHLRAAVGLALCSGQLSCSLCIPVICLLFNRGSCLKTALWDTRQQVAPVSLRELVGRPPWFWSCTLSLDDCRDQTQILF